MTSPTDHRHIVLVGLMGSGKSSVGRRLAQQLGRTFIDTDRLVEQSAQTSVRSIFETRGEEEFRRLETLALEEAMSSSEPAVIAAAGGVVLSETNRRLLVQAAHSHRIVVVWLDTSTSELVERVKRGAHRPLLDGNPKGTLDRMSEDRHDLYAEVANVVVDTNERSIDDVAREVTRVLGVDEVRHG